MFEAASVIPKKILSEYFVYFMSDNCGSGGFGPAQILLDSRV